MCVIRREAGEPAIEPSRNWFGTWIGRIMTENYISLVYIHMERCQLMRNQVKKKKSSYNFNKQVIFLFSYNSPIFFLYTSGTLITRRAEQIEDCS